MSPHYITTMRHHNTNRKFGREKNSRTALLRSLAIALITHERIQTTEERAKEIRPYVEKLVTKARANTLACRRHLVSLLGSGGEEAARKLLEDLGPRYHTRPGGYLRIVKTRRRLGSDGASLATIEFVQD